MKPCGGCEEAWRPALLTLREIGLVVQLRTGWQNRRLINCTVTAMGGQPVTDDIVFTGFFTPASG